MLQLATGASTVLTNPTQFSRLFEEYNGLIFRTAYRITGNSADAEDVLQTIFLRLVRRDAADDLASEESYFRRAAVNASLDILRARKSDAQVPLQDAGLSGRERSGRKRNARLSTTCLCPVKPEVRRDFCAALPRGLFESRNCANARYVSSPCGGHSSPYTASPTKRNPFLHRRQAMKQQDLDQILADMRAQEPPEGAIHSAGKRVFRNVFDTAYLSERVERIKGCADFRKLIPSYLDRSLAAARVSLLEDHISQCVECRRVLRQEREGNRAEQVIPVASAKSQKRHPILPWALAASLAAGTAIGVTGAFNGLLPGQHAVRATVVSVQGTLYKVSDVGSSLLEAGAVIRNAEELRTAKGFAGDLSIGKWRPGGNGRTFGCVGFAELARNFAGCRTRPNHCAGNPKRKPAISRSRRRPARSCAKLRFCCEPWC